MSSLHSFSLILGCGGFKHHNLIICSSTINTIVNFDRHFDTDQSEKIMSFLDYTCSLFDVIIADWNKIVNTLQILHDRFGLINDQLWQDLYVWMPIHKKCGAYLKLILNENLDNVLAKELEELILPKL